MYVHQQRFPDDYRDALALPLALHLARLATEYALPHELTEGTREQEGEQADGSEGENGDTPTDEDEGAPFGPRLAITTSITLFTPPRQTG
jgi:hypothetical protein